MKIECWGCGSTFELASQKSNKKLKEDILCTVCGALLYYCNEAKKWTATLLEKKENHRLKR